MGSTTSPQREERALSIVDVVDGVSQKLPRHEDAAALRSVSRGLRYALDSVRSSLSPCSLHLVPGKFPALKSLDLTRLSRPVDDAALAGALEGLRGLTALSLGGAGCAELRAAGLAPIGGLTRLRLLSVQGCRKARWSVLSSWHALRLESLTLVGLTATPADVSALADLLAAGCGEGLTRLVLGDACSLSFVPDAAIGAALCACSPRALRRLDLSGSLELTDAGLAPVSALTGLTELVLHNCMKLGDRAVAALSRLSSLRCLNLRGCSQLGDHHAAALFPALAGLEALSLQSCAGLTGACLEAIARGAPRLTRLNLSRCVHLEEGRLRALGGMSGLTWLDLTACPVPGPAGLTWLSALTALTTLRGEQWRQAPPPPRVPPRRAVSSVAAGAASAASSSAAALAGAAHGALRLPPRLARLDLRSAALTPSSLAALLRGLPPKSAASLDLRGLRPLRDERGGGGGGGGDGPHGPGGRAGAAGWPCGGAPAVFVSEVEAVSRLTALTALSVECVTADPAPSPPAALDVCGAASWPPAGPLVALGHGGAARAAAVWAEAGKAGGGGGGAAGVACGGCRARRVLDLDAWATRDPAPLQLTPGRGDEEAALPAPFAAALGWAPRGACDCACAGGWGDASAVVVTFPGDGPGSQASSSSAASGSDCLVGTWGHAISLAGAALASGAPSAAATAAAAAGGHHWRAWRGWAAGQRAPEAVPPPGALSTWLSPLLQLQRLAVTDSPWLTDRALASLSGLHRLRCLDVSRCNAFTGAGFGALSALTALTELGAAGCEALDDAGVGAAAGAFGGSLRRLNLDSCRGVTDAGVAALAAAATGLSSLVLRRNGSAGAGATAALARLRGLRQLVLSHCATVDDSALLHLAAAPALAELWVGGAWRLTDDGVHALLSASSSLLRLDVEGCPRLFSANGCVPPGFEGRADPQRGSCRPGVIRRCPPSGRSNAAEDTAAARDSDFLAALE
ncbi:hypothetical protein Rsub_08811 [Raphidocelis subcapitata]|uniref:F-box/LRR-repeat protein 15-like leucin rich repeat domain-containing protein n=1 Tax=Raphidocelis subcapitata TaxID=307507 RepID=A0A2V0P825_9CHLO|nr:hypothetical protein Rsub_08811 [Raphidocelis subcapitata]|eukprot:GBF95996.1 hypothetical protein Rsub_08811 [Raphidocelis subcapitata]